MTLRTRNLEQADIEQAARSIADAAEITVIAHERPDGDAVGSMLALAIALRRADKRVHSVLAGGLPSRWKFLSGADQVVRNPPSKDTLVIAVDAADIDRLGFSSPPDVHINIDHHPSNTMYATTNLVDPVAAATTEILYRLAPKLGISMDADVARSLLTGLVTDTLGFRTTSVVPGTLRMAAELMEAGADLAELYKKALVDRSFEAVRYWGSGLSTLEKRGDMIWASLGLSGRESAGYPGQDDADLIDILTTIREVRVALVFVELSDGRVKVSWRARPGVDVAQVAAGFDGGGHTLAAGAQVEGTLDEVVARVLEATARAMSPTAEVEP